jgi:hypothetical protein
VNVETLNVADLDGLVRDARRYRWLRTHCVCITEPVRGWCEGDGLDKTADAGIAHEEHVAWRQDHEAEQ